MVILVLVISDVEQELKHACTITLTTKYENNDYADETQHNPIQIIAWHISMC